MHEATKIHCIVCKDLETGERFSAHTPAQQREARHILAEAPAVIAHNGIRYDAPMLLKHHGLDLTGKTFDTLIALRLLFGDGDDFKARDFNALRKKTYPLPNDLIGRHSLEAWGYRVGHLKGTFGKTTNWSAWTPEMQTYCEQDVDVLQAVYEFIHKIGFSGQAIALEMAFAEVIHKQIEHGFPFDAQAGGSLYAELCAERETLRKELDAVFPPEVVETSFIPKRNNRTKGYVAGVPFIKREEVVFNPNSRQQVAKRLKELHGWQPVEYTPTGEPKIDDDVLKSLPYPEAAVLARWYELAKILGMVAEGPHGWLKKVSPENRIHGEVNTLGTVTGRCAHSRPNLGQIPKKGVLGERCRACFAAPPGWSMVGADASGIQLRVLAHFMARYDGGAYVDVVLNGDIHTTNQNAAGITTRDDAKTFIYAYLFGAGDGKLGSIVAPHSNQKSQRIIGGRLRKRFETQLPALKRLKDAIVVARKERGCLLGIDKRRLTVRSAHVALNLIIQAAEAVLVKFATVLWHQLAAEAGYTWAKDWAQVVHVHDEVQGIARTKEIAEHLGQLFVQAIELAGRYYEFRCPTTGEYKIGNNWKETH